jgi:hypothetical protein
VRHSIGTLDDERVAVQGDQHHPEQGLVEATQIHLLALLCSREGTVSQHQQRSDRQSGHEESCGQQGLCQPSSPSDRARITGGNAYSVTSRRLTSRY